MPKRKSESEKKLTNNPGKRVLKQDAPDFDTPETLKAPNTLRPDAVKYWDVASKQLHDKGLLQTPDIPLLVTYCNAMAIAELAYQQMGDQLVVANPSCGTEYMNPRFKAAQTAERLALSIASKFGFNPASRSALKIDIKGRKGKLLLMRNEGIYGPKRPT